MGKTTDDKENESRGFEDVALTLSWRTVLKSTVVPPKVGVPIDPVRPRIRRTRGITLRMG
jgi:hypothetical protein